MSNEHPQPPTEAPAANDPDAIRADIERTRENLAETVDLLHAKLDVKSQAKAQDRAGPRPGDHRQRQASSRGDRRRRRRRAARRRARLVAPELTPVAPTDSGSSSGLRGRRRRPRISRGGAGGSYARVRMPPVDLPHPVTGRPHPSPVPPGTGWPDDPARPGTPVASDAADVRRLAAASDLDELGAAVSVCRACDRLVRWREDVARDKRASYAREPYWGRPIHGWGSTTPAVLVRRARAGRERRQPHRTDLHRRPLRRLAVRVAAPGRARDAADLACTPGTANGWSAPGWWRPCAAPRRTTGRPSRSATPARPGCCARSPWCSPRCARSSASARTAGTPRCAPSAPSGTTCRGPSRASATPPRPS